MWNPGISLQTYLTSNIIAKTIYYMSGQMYSSSEDAIRAFQSKNLLGKFIVFNESNPTEKDFDEGSELYKILWMGHYYMWLEFGKMRLRPLEAGPLSRLFQTGDYLRFKVTVEKNYMGSSVWVIETNAPLDIPTMINLLVNKRQLMIDKYRNLYGSTALDSLSEKLAGTNNRFMPLIHNSLYGEWIATEIEGDYWPLISDRESIECELQAPSYTVNFHGDNGCTFGGEHPESLKAKGIYDSRYNIVVANDGKTVLAYVVSINKDDELKVVIRYYNGSNGVLYKRDDDQLLIVNYKRASALKRLIATP